MSHADLAMMVGSAAVDMGEKVYVEKTDEVESNVDKELILQQEMKQEIASAKLGIDKNIESMREDRRILGLVPILLGMSTPAIHLLFESVLNIKKVAGVPNLSSDSFAEPALSFASVREDEQETNSSEEKILPTQNIRAHVGRPPAGVESFCKFIVRCVLGILKDHPNGLCFSDVFQECAMMIKEDGRFVDRPYNRQTLYNAMKNVPQDKVSRKYGIWTLVEESE